MRGTRPLAALCVTLACSGSALAEDHYPSKVIRLVVGFGAGGPTDIPARYVADKLGTALGERVIVENKPAAAGMLAARDVLSQPADGYNLLFCTHFESINSAVYKNPGFKLAELEPVSLVAKYYYALALSTSIPPRSFEEFVEYSKAHPGDVSYATIGAGSAQEIMARQLEKISGISMNRVPFRGGPQVVQELVAGRVNFYVSPTLAVMPHYRSGQLKLLAVTSPSRIGNLPDVPTLKEKSVDYVRFGWLGICAPKGTPQPIVARLNKEIGAIVAMPEYRDLIEKGGSIAEASTPEELGKIIAQTTDDVTAAVQEFGLQQE